MLSIQDLLSGEIVKPRQQAQANTMEGIGTLLSFLAQGNVGMPQLPQMPGGGPVDAGAIMQMLADKRKTDRVNKQQEEDQAYRQKILGTPGTDRIPTPLLNAKDATNGTGFLGGELDPMQTMAMLAQAKDPTTAAAGLAMLNDKFQPKNSTLQHVTMGVPGKEGWLQNAILSPDGTAKPIGEPWKQASGVNIDLGSGGVQRILTDAEKKDKGFSASSVVGVDRKGEMKVLQQPTEAQGKDAGRAVMQATTNDQLESLFKDGFDPTKQSLRDAALQPWLETEGPAGPVIASQARKYMDPKALRYQQIQNTWVETFGRDASGGAIKPEEYGSWRNMYFPQQGDDLQTVLNKNATRAAYEKALSARSGESAIKDVKPEMADRAPGAIVKPALSPSTREEIANELRRRGLLK
jgi:hypothetical protein